MTLRVRLWAFLLLGAPLVAPVRAQTGAATGAKTPAQIVAAGKAATVLVEVPDGSGSAFCIAPSGLFATNAHVVEHLTQAQLVLFPGERFQRIVTAKVVRRDDEADLALLWVDPPLATQAPGLSPLSALLLGSGQGLLETQPVTVFGFPFGTDLALHPDEMPDVTVTSGRITSLRHSQGRLQEIQLDAGADPGNSGGPVLNERGEVIGILYAGIAGHSQNFAIAIDRLKSLLLAPQLTFDAPSIAASEQHQTREFRFSVVPFDLPTAGATGVAGAGAGPTSVYLSLKIGDRPARIFQARPVGGNTWSVKAVPVPLDQTNDAELSGIRYSLSVRGTGGPLAERNGTLFVERTAPISPVLPALQAPALDGDKAVIPLPAPAQDEVVGGGGRYLIFYLKTLRKLAVFDVSTRQLRYISLASDEAFFAAGAQKLVVVLPEPNVIERYDLATLNRELVVPKPEEGEVRSLSLGAASAGPFLMVSFASFGDSRASFFDLQTLQKMDVESSKPTGSWGSLWDDNFYQVRASDDGQTFTGWFTGMSPSGLDTLRLSGHLVEQNHLHESVGHVVANSDGTRFYTGRGLYSADLKPLDNDLKSMSCVPAEGDAYFLALSLAPKAGNHKFGQGFNSDFSSFDQPQPLAVSLYSTADRKLLLNLPPLEELTATQNNFIWGRETMTLEKRIHFYPGANLLVTLPSTSDSIVLRRFNLVSALNQAGLDYLFVSSSPPATARKGSPYRYPIEVKSKRGALVFNLESGPPGATLSRGGVLVWNVPKNYAGTEESILISIRDALGQQIYHSFKVRVLL